MGETSYGRSRNLSVNWEFSKKECDEIKLSTMKSVFNIPQGTV
jgi:hypothetical protein